MKNRIICLLSVVALLGCAKEDVINPIIVDTDFTILDNYYGGAVQWEPGDRDGLTEAQWNRLSERVAYMDLGYIRCCVMPYFYCFGYDGDRPLLLWENDGSQVDSRWYANSSRFMEELYRQLAFCEEHNIDVLLGEWWKPMNNCWEQAIPIDMPKYTIEVDDPRYAVQVAEMIKHLVSDKGFTCIKQFNFGNEVNLQGETNGYTWEKWKQSMLNLRSELDKRGLEDVSLVGPDGGYWGDLWFYKTLDELDSMVSVIDYHWYIHKDWILSHRVEDETRAIRFFTQLQNPRKVNIWGEMGVRDGHDEKYDQHTLIHQWWYGTFAAAVLIQTMRSGWSGSVAWDMDDAMHYKDATDKQKRWGFWNSVAEQKGVPEEAAIRPWFYTWSLMSKYFPKGSSLLYCNSYRDDNIDCIAALTPSGDVSFAIVNTSGFAHRVTLQIPNIVNRPKVKKYVYFENDYPIGADGFPEVKEVIAKADFSKGITIDFPSEGFVLLTTAGGPSPKIVKDRSKLTDPMDGLQRMYDHSDNLGFNGFARFYDVCGDNTPDFQISRVLFDRGCIHPSTDDVPAYVTYRLDGFHSFSIDVSGKETIEGRFKVYVSYNQDTWKELEVAFATPELSVHKFVHTTLVPMAPIDGEGYNYLKIEMHPNGYFSDTRLREVRISK